MIILAVCVGAFIVVVVILLMARPLRRPNFRQKRRGQR